ncbi:MULTISPECIES: hypothetical protein [unclassified Prosthecochloris]|uniref:hypothetical protein n=1 Tax=unclassified Prosthecochloris TaxID=2632826 RepID=UPI00223D4B1D|nr:MULTISPECIES: hypothetical protein [unclassified Prosthecochloris]UZJ37192.1 hypothetical protein OO005_10610 [Prosthecochloris sp. SCSIO W1103]UZJ39006.1 hypothetical protein OO185_03455 [Prosthecochloris sp. SCSIO W1102]
MARKVGVERYRDLLKKRAMCIENANSETIGFAAFSRETKPIEWLKGKEDYIRNMGLLITRMPEQ